MHVEGFLHSMFDLSGKTAVVIAASRGIGRQISTVLSKAGAGIVVVDLPETEMALNLAAEEIASNSRSQVHAICGDVSQWASVEALHRKVSAICSQVDILVNVAGVQVRKPTIEFTEEDWNHVINVNMRGTFRACQMFGQNMIHQGGGHIINIASLNSVVSLPERAVYCMSKAGVVAMTKSLAIEWAKHNITVNAISPGYFKTEMTAPLFKQSAWVKRLMLEIPCERAGMPSDLDGLVVLLASDASGYITGQNLFVDGGFTAGEMM